MAGEPQRPVPTRSLPRHHVPKFSLVAYTIAAFLFLTAGAIYAVGTVLPRAPSRATKAVVSPAVFTPVPATAAPTRSPLPSLHAMATTLRKCSAGDLGAEYWGINGGGGHSWDVVRVFNRSSSRCVVNGRPSAVLYNRRGKPLARDTGQGTFADVGRVELVIVDPGTERVNALSGGLLVAVVTISQGTCPGGIIPDGARLDFVVAGGHVALPGFSELPFGYRCDASPDSYPPPHSPPQIYVSNFSQITNDRQEPPLDR